MNFNKIALIITLLCLSAISNAKSQLRDPETTRMISMGGAGVASILIDEAPIFNPASIIFFNQSTLRYQQTREELQDKSKDRTSSFEKGSNELLVLTDTSSAMKGGFAYSYQNTNAGKRKQFSLSFANNLGKKSGVGIGIKHSEEESNITNRTYDQIIIGGTHLHNKKLIFGFNIVDPVQVVDEYFSYRIGAQYTVSSTITLVGDIGSGDTKNFNKEMFTLLSVQLQTFESLFLRYGKFHNKMLNEKGQSFGFSWQGPKLALDYAVKSSEFISEESDTLLTDEKLLETSLGLTLLF